MFSFYSKFQVLKRDILDRLCLKGGIEMERKEIVVGSNDSGQRLDKFLFKTFPELPHSLLYKALRKKDVRYCGRKATGDVIVEEGNPVALYLPNDVLKKRIVDVSSFSNKPIKVIFEDSQILIVDKPAGLLCHSDRTNEKDTLIARVYYYLYKEGSYNQLKNRALHLLCATELIKELQVLF